MSNDLEFCEIIFKFYFKILKLLSFLNQLIDFNIEISGKLGMLRRKITRQM